MFTNKQQSLFWILLYRFIQSLVDFYLSMKVNGFLIFLKI